MNWLHEVKGWFQDVNLWLDEMPLLEALSTLMSTGFLLGMIAGIIKVWLW